MRAAIEDYVEREKSASRCGKTRLQRGPPMRQPDCMSPAKKPTSGWRNSKPARKLLLGNARPGGGESALRDVDGLNYFLAPKSAAAAQRAIKVIRRGRRMDSPQPEIGRRVEDMAPEFREWVREFGHDTYIALYHYDGKQVVLLAVRPGRQAGY
jgi:plasmid stabilization system protein ParE